MAEELHTRGFGSTSELRLRMKATASGTWKRNGGLIEREVAEARSGNKKWRGEEEQNAGTSHRKTTGSRGEKWCSPPTEGESSS